MTTELNAILVEMETLGWDNKEGYKSIILETVDLESVENFRSDLSRVIFIKGA